VGADTPPTGAPTAGAAAKPQPGPAPPQAPSGGIPLKAGVIIITALNDPLLGDHESIKRIASVNDQRITIAYAADIAVPEGMAGKPNEVQELRVRRTVLREDLRSAREYRQMFGNNQPDVFQGSTALGVSAAVLSDLKTKGSSPITVAAEGIGGALGGMLGGLLGTAAPKELDAMSKWSGTITRVATGPTTISVLVNGVPTALPVVHAKGTVGDDDVNVEFFFLDDPGNPISIKFSIGDTDLQVVRIEFPIDQAPTPEASTTSAATIEQALKTSGTFDVYGIYFDFGSDRIKPESEPVLREIAKVMADNPAWTLSVDGHTDNIGGDAYNLDLSKRRAAAVKQALVTRYKSDGTRLQTNGFGASRPKDVNTTFEGRARNRRVELVRK
jgi:outer membrane protein OmpA-like peptidoglycan-associated protein